MDMQHREHSISKHNEYTYGWISIQEIYLITCLCLLPPMTALQRYPEYNATTANTTLLVLCVSSTRGSEAELRSVSNHMCMTGL